MAYTLDHLYQACSFCIILAIIASYHYFFSRKRKVYLIDHSCFKPSATLRAPLATFMEHFNMVLGESNPKAVEFQVRMLERSGLGEETCLPPVFHYIPPHPTMKACREEAELVIFSAVDGLMGKTGLKGKDVDVLIVNCCLFAPTPSLSDMVVNRYKMRSNLRSFNISGMGCSAGIVSIDLARDLLQVHPNTRVLIISTEILTLNSYKGAHRSMLLTNCLFRMGGAAILLSNYRHDRPRAKYQLSHVVRTHKGSEDASYKCVHQEEDAEGVTGIALSKDLMVIAGDALKANITSIAPLVLPITEQLHFLSSFILKKLVNPKKKAYLPNFKQAFEHFCIHAGGRAVIDALQKSLSLSAEHVEASRMTLYRFGNTSSSSLWYELSYMETKGRMKKGNRVWQIAFGSGFKCNSAVWRCLRSLPAPVDSPWADCIDRYPVHIPEVVKL